MTLDDGRLRVPSGQEAFPWGKWHGELDSSNTHMTVSSAVAWRQLVELDVGKKSVASRPNRNTNLSGWWFWINLLVPDPTLTV